MGRLRYQKAYGTQTIITPLPVIEDYLQDHVRCGAGTGPSYATADQERQALRPDQV